jgi:hypothetical protein
MIKRGGKIMTRAKNTQTRKSFEQLNGQELQTITGGVETCFGCSNLVRNSAGMADALTRKTNSINSGWTISKSGQGEYLDLAQKFGTLAQQANENATQQAALSCKSCTGLRQQFQTLNQAVKAL